MDPIPLMPPPDGQTSDFNAPYNTIQMGNIVSFAITFFLATILLGLRYIQAYKISKTVELNLALATISWGLSFTYFMTTVEMMKYAWGKHLWNITFDDFNKFLTITVPNAYVYFICPSVTRMAMLSILYSINPSRAYRCIVVGIAVASFIYSLVLCVIFAGPCNIITTRDQLCSARLTQAHAVITIAADLAVVAVPIPTIHRLKLSGKQKISVGCILALGSGVVICSIARLPYIINIDASNDPLYYEAVLGIWSIVELNLGIICVCAVRLRELIIAFMPQFGQFVGRWTNFTRSHGTGTQSWSQGIDKSLEQQSYQLHSIQRSCGEGEPERTDKRILRTDKIEVEYTNRENDSTEDILPGRIPADPV